MKLVSYALAREMEPRLGFVTGKRVVDVLRAALWLKDHRGRVDFFHLPSTMTAALKDWAVTFPLLQDLAAAVASLELDGLYSHNRPVALLLEEVILFPPVPAPPSIRLFPAETRASAGSPFFFYANPHSLLGHKQPLRYPTFTRQLDFDLTLAVVLARGGRDFSATEAAEAVAGFTILNDWTARDRLELEQAGGWGPAKAKDFGTSVGPWLVTPDEWENLRLGSGYNLLLVARRNGTEIARLDYRNPPFSFTELIVEASRETELYPGDILACTGLPRASLVKLTTEEPPEWLQPGETVELEIQGLGKLETPIVGPGI